MFKFLFGFGGFWKKGASSKPMPTPPQPTPGKFNIVYHGQPVVKGTDTIIKTN